MLLIIYQIHKKTSQKTKDQRNFLTLLRRHRLTDKRNYLLKCFKIEEHG